jgi:hypothetical protein
MRNDRKNDTIPRLSSGICCKILFELNFNNKIRNPTIEKCQFATTICDKT